VHIGVNTCKGELRPLQDRSKLCRGVAEGSTIIRKKETVTGPRGEKGGGSLTVYGGGMRTAIPTISAGCALVKAKMWSRKLISYCTECRELGWQSGARRVLQIKESPLVAVY